MNHPVIFSDLVKMQILTQEAWGGPESISNKLPTDANVASLRDCTLSSKYSLGQLLTDEATSVPKS